MPPVIYQAENEVQADLLEKTLSPRGMESAVIRLRWISLICAVLAILAMFVRIWLQPERTALLHSPIIIFLWACVLLSALAIGAIRRFELLSASSILNLGICFEVLISFVLSFVETMTQLSTTQTVLGISTVTLWITAVGFLMPHRPRVKLFTALLSATMWPLAYIINLSLHEFVPLPLNRLALWVYPPYMMALVTYAFARRLYQIENAAQKAQDLGSYSLVSLIGAGGMGEVWRARHHMLARDAAIKLIRADLNVRDAARAANIRHRFKREARTIAALHSPHTVYLFDFGVAQNGNFYYAMELLDGISLQALVDQFGPLPAARVAYILKQTCLSLAEAHQHNLIHRDIKPSNIFVCNCGVEYDFTKVLDFGLAKNIANEDSVLLTNDGVTAGTPAYMAPEIAMGDEILDSKVDVYGLGCVAYFLLTGVPVFEEKTATATALAHVQKAPDPPSLRSEMTIPADMEKLILRCLAKKPQERPGALELKKLLDACAIADWTQDDAHDWWETYLPASSSHRLARQAHPTTPVSEP